MNFKEEFVKDSKAILDLGIEEEGKRQEKVEVFVKEITHKNYKELCKENDLGLCLIAFVDGKDKTTMKKSINLLKDLQKREDIKGESNDESKSSFRMAVKGSQYECGRDKKSANQNSRKPVGRGKARIWHCAFHSCTT